MNPQTAADFLIVCARLSARFGFHLTATPCLKVALLILPKIMSCPTNRSNPIQTKKHLTFLILYQIFIHLDQSTLGICAQVSKLWANVAIPLLYHCPKPHSTLAFESLNQTLHSVTFFNYIKYLNGMDLSLLASSSFVHVLKPFSLLISKHLQLKYLNLNHSIAFDDRYSALIVVLCQGLKQCHLKATGLRTLQFLKPQDIPLPCGRIIFIQPGLELNYLDLEKCLQIRASQFLVIADHCPHLICLNLASTYVDDHALISIIQSCQYLEWLSLKHCGHVSDRSFISLFCDPGLTRLKHLEIPIIMVTESAMQLFDKSHHSLESISFSANIPHPNKDLEMSLFFQQFSQLKKITFQHCHITDSSLQALAESCGRSLNELYILYHEEAGVLNDMIRQYRDNFSEHAFASLSIDLNQRTTHPPEYIQMKELQIVGCNRPVHLHMFRTLLPALESSLISLNLSHCNHHVNDSVIHTLVQQCRMLKILNVTGCWKLTDHCMNNISDSLSILQQLHIYDCFQVTEQGIRLVCSKSKRLSFLGVSTDPNHSSTTQLWARLGLGIPRLPEYFAKIILESQSAINEESLFEGLNRWNIEELSPHQDYVHSLSPIDVLAIQSQYPNVYIDLKIPKSDLHRKWIELLNQYQGQAIQPFDLLLDCWNGIAKKDREWRCSVAVVAYCRSKRWIPRVAEDVLNFVLC